MNNSVPHFKFLYYPFSLFYLPLDLEGGRKRQRIKKITIQKVTLCLYFRSYGSRCYYVDVRLQ